jgi:hypothetical protein
MSASSCTTAIEPMTDKARLVKPNPSTGYRRN